MPRERIFLILAIIVFSCAYSSCSLSSHSVADNASTKITGGTAVNITDVPYMAAIEFMGRFACPAVLISPQWLATSAVCMELIYPEDIVVRTGSTVFEDGGHLYPVQAIVRHPQFEDNFNVYDFALVQVALNITMNPATRVVPIATTPPSPNTSARVSGWGAVAEGSILHRSLLVADLPIYNTTQCVERYTYDVTDQWICTLKEGSGPCDSDEGDPLVVSGALVGTKIWILQQQCGDLERPSPYVNLANPVFRDFIRTTAGV